MMKEKDKQIFNTVEYFELKVAKRVGGVSLKKATPVKQSYKVRLVWCFVFFSIISMKICCTLRKSIYVHSFTEVRRTVGFAVSLSSPPQFKVLTVVSHLEHILLCDHII